MKIIPRYQNMQNTSISNHCIFTVLALFPTRFLELSPPFRQFLHLCYLLSIRYSIDGPANLFGSRFFGIRYYFRESLPCRARRSGPAAGSLARDSDAWVIRVLIQFLPRIRVIVCLETSETVTDSDGSETAAQLAAAAIRVMGRSRY
jgi:hypothetical protein